MLRKFFALCVCLCLLLPVASAEEELYLAFVSDAMSKTGGDHANYERDMIYVHAQDLGDFWMRILEDGPAVEAYHKQGVRFTLDRTPKAVYGSDDVVTPASVELIGAITGELVSLDDTSLVTKVYDWGAVVDDAPTKRLIVNEQTQIENNVQAGDPANLLYEPDTEIVLLVIASNG